MVTIELDEQTAKKYERFCQYEQELMAERENWKQLKDYCAKMQFGGFTLSVKDGQPYKISNAMQELLLIKIHKI